MSLSSPPATVLRPYLEPGRFCDSGHPAVIAFARDIAPAGASPRQAAIALYRAVRDRFHYNPYRIDLRPAALRASALLTRDHGYCIEKANLLAAAARATGIPSRLGFANVRNHLGTARLEAFLGTDLLVFHGYTELFLDGRWVKATPAFNAALCHRLGVEPLEFDGRHDSIFQEFTPHSGRYMEYVHDYGTFADVPRDRFIAELKQHYPHLFDGRETPDVPPGWEFIIE